MSYLRACYSSDIVFDKVEQLGLELLWFSAVCWQFGHLRDLAKSQAVLHSSVPQLDGKRKNIEMLGSIGSAGRSSLSNKSRAEGEKLLQLFFQQSHPAFPDLMGAIIE